MALVHSPKVVTSNLIFAVDPRNDKSYPGSGNIMINLVPGNNANTSPTGVIGNLNDSTAGRVLNYNTSNTITVTFPNAVNRNTWSMIYFTRSTGLTTSDYRSIITLAEPNASHGYYYTVDTREVATSYVLGYQKDFTLNSWLTYAHNTISQWSAQTWWFLGVSFDNNVVKHYTNGLLVNTQTQTRDLNGYGNITKLILNLSNGNTVCLGPVLFYDRVLTDSEFLINFQAIRGRFRL